jgi:Zn ribbon nucleic-acid-binding protein
MNELTPEALERIREISEKMAEATRYWTPGGFFDARIDEFMPFLTELALSHAQEKEEMKSEVANYTSKTEQAFASLHSENSQLRARVEELESVICPKCKSADTVNVVNGDKPETDGLFECYSCGHEFKPEDAEDRIAALQSALKVAEEALARVLLAPKHAWSWINPVAEALAEIARLTGAPKEG